MPDTALLDVRNLRTYFHTEAGVVKAVDDVSLDVRRGETVGLVGESGSGKTVTSLSIMRIVPRPGRIMAGSILFDGENLLAKSEEEMRRIRGKKMAMVFQDPGSSLDPLFTVGDQVSEVLRHHESISKSEAVERTVKLFEMVGIPEPEARVNEYPHEFSGGMKQRVCVARAIALRPGLLFADEPTTNLDVTIQAQVLELLKSLQKSLGMSMVMITHDMGIVAELTERVTVLYAGMVCETGTTEEVFYRPKHPYTEALLATVPRIDKRKKLETIPGNIPNLIEPPSGCRFHPRCRYATDLCKEKPPVLEETVEGHTVACHHWKELSLTGGG